MNRLRKYVPDHVSIRRVIGLEVSFLCVASAWLVGGVYGPAQWPLTLITLVLALSVIFLSDSRSSSMRSKVFRDPVFYLGAAFVGLIALQSLNSGFWVVVSDSGGLEFMEIPPHWLPWSVELNGSLEMLIWFAPAWIMLVFVRNLLGKSHVKLIFHLMAWNAALLSVFGIILRLNNSESIMGVLPARAGRFFASFDYLNHASEWFCLHALLAAGLFHDALKKNKPRSQQIVWALCFLLTTVALFFTLSRVGAAIAVAAFLIVMVVAMRKFLPMLSGQAKVNSYIISALGFFMILTLFFGVGGGALAREVKESLEGRAIEGVHDDFQDRFHQYPQVISIVKDFPLFGTGGWGYRWVAPMNVELNDELYWEGEGRANVHCDLLQFLSEFGIIGLGLLIGVVFYLVIRIVGIKGVLSRWMLAGLLVLSLHSLFDLPFRCPAIIYSWLMMLSGLGVLRNKTETESP